MKLFIQSDGESLNNHHIVLKEKVYAIERPKPWKNRTNLNNISNIRRSVAPECFHCFDKSDTSCKECGCKICGGKDDPDQIILCDECEDEYHLKCLKPPLTQVPKQDWFCTKCENDKDENVL